MSPRTFCLSVLKHRLYTAVALLVLPWLGFLLTTSAAIERSDQYVDTSRGDSTVGNVPPFNA